MLALRARPQLDLVDRLLEHGADADARDDHGWTGLHILSAADQHRRTLARRLVLRGARPSRDRAGRSPAQLCALLGLQVNDGGPFDPRTAVAAGPGPAPALPKSTLTGPLLDELAPLPPDPAVSPAVPGRGEPRRRGASHHWQVWADWLQAHGDPRGELVAASVAASFVGTRRRAHAAAELVRAELAAASWTQRGLDCADPFNPLRTSPSHPLELTWTHGFLTGARVSVHAARRRELHGPPDEPTVETAVSLMRHEPLLATLHLILGMGGWARALELLRAQPPNPRLRRLILGGLPPTLPTLDRLRELLPEAHSLHLIGAKKIERARLRWPGLRSLRLRHGDADVTGRGGVELALDVPDLTHLDLGLPVASRETTAEGEGLGRLLISLAEGAAPKLEHLRLDPLRIHFAVNLLAAPLIDRLRTVELVGVDGVAIERLAEQADRLARLERVRLSLAPAVAQLHGAALARLREAVPRLDLDVGPGWPRQPFGAWSHTVSRRPRASARSDETPS